MRSRITPSVVTADLGAHPATVAWAEATGDRGAPSEIQVLKEPGSRLLSSAVYRLSGIGPTGAGVIAKRCRRHEGDIERFVYERIVPLLPLPHLVLYADHLDADDRVMWLFLEEATGIQFSYAVSEHRRAAADWLAGVHAGTRDSPLLEELPDRGPAHYHDHLVSANAKIESSLANPVATPEDIQTLREVQSHLERIEHGWGGLGEICAELPRALVHGDFKRTNLRVIESRRNSSLQVFDWAEAGYGIVGVDLFQVDLERYGESVRDTYPCLTGNLLRECRGIGTAFRALASVDWEASRLKYQWIKRAMRHMRIYEQWLSESLEEASWVVR